MSLVLHHPVHGYYSKKNILGSYGDFITAPEISQTFGELIATWIIYNSKVLTKNTFNYAELGPGKGTLSQDIFRTIKKLDLTLYKKIKSVFFLEKSNTFIKMLEEKFDKALIIKDIIELEKKSTIFLANEFFDALPVNQYIRKNNAWYEKKIVLKNNNLIFQLASKPTIKKLFFPEKTKDGAIFEYSEYSNYIISNICKVIKKYNGAFIIIDYAKKINDNNGTLTAIYKHKHVSPFYMPGQVDLSVRPDFDLIKKIALLEKCEVFGPINQGFFLETLGINERIERLIKKNPTLKDVLLSQRDRLIKKNYMGEKFKVLIITQKKLESFFK
ncbi:SAM-dependent methyltransferase [Alphaproteobacteria bacterium]|nr:SAM-dependent methyltransferase [Alphaproteobacteria bacterium]